MLPDKFAITQFSCTPLGEDVVEGNHHEFDLSREEKELLALTLVFQNRVTKDQQLAKEAFQELYERVNLSRLVALGLLKFLVPHTPRKTLSVIENLLNRNNTGNPAQPKKNFNGKGIGGSKSTDISTSADAHTKPNKNKEDTNAKPNRLAGSDANIDILFTDPNAIDIPLDDMLQSPKNKAVLNTDAKNVPLKNTAPDHNNDNDKNPNEVDPIIHFLAGLDR